MSITVNGRRIATDTARDAGTIAERERVGPDTVPLDEPRFEQMRRKPWSMPRQSIDDAQPGPLESFEAFLDYVDKHWRLWFAMAILAGAAAALITLYFTTK